MIPLKFIEDFSDLSFIILKITTILTTSRKGIRNMSIEKMKLIRKSNCLALKIEVT